MAKSSHSVARVRDKGAVTRCWSRRKWTRLRRRQKTTAKFPLRWMLRYFSSNGLISVYVRSGAVKASYVRGVSECKVVNQYAKRGLYSLHLPMKC